MNILIRLIIAALATSSPLALQTIGAPSDGDHYSVTSYSEVTKADGADCGFNDLSVANVAIFRRE